MECAGHRSLLFVEHLGIRLELERIKEKYPGRVERNVGNVVGRSSVKERLGKRNTEQPASVEWTVIGRDALGIRRGKLPRSTICEMQARNRSLEYANCGSMALDVLAGRFRYYSWTGHARCAACVCHIGLLFGKCFWIGKVQQHHRIGSETNLQVGVLRYCSFVGYRNRFCI